MTRKDYELIQGSIARTISITGMTEKNQVKKQAKMDALRLIASDLAGSIYGENKAFDRDRFLKDCGVK